MEDTYKIHIQDNIVRLHIYIYWFLPEIWNFSLIQLEYYKHTQLEKKAVDLIIEKGSITEVEPDAVEEGVKNKEEDTLKEEKE